MSTTEKASNTDTLEDLISEMYIEVLPFINGANDELEEAIKTVLGEELYGFFQGQVPDLLNYLSPLVATSRKLGRNVNLPEDREVRKPVFVESFNNLFEIVGKMREIDSAKNIGGELTDFLVTYGIPEGEIGDNYANIVYIWGVISNILETKPAFTREKKPA